MPMMALLPPRGPLGGYPGDLGGVNGSWEEACTCVSTPIRVRVVGDGPSVRNTRCLGRGSENYRYIIIYIVPRVFRDYTR